MGNPDVRAESEGFLPIEVGSLRLDSVTDFNIYLYNRLQKRHVLYRSNSTPFRQVDRNRLVQNDIEKLYISYDDRNKLQRYLETNLAETVSDTSMDVAERSRIVYQTAAGLVREALEGLDVSENVRRCRHVVGNVAQFIFTDKSALNRLLHLASVDYRTYTHSVNVCTYGLALGRYRGLTSLQDMCELGMGLLLHDLGMAKVPGEILSKEGPLTDEERELVNKHPASGHASLAQSGLPRRVLEVVLSHHENADGSGYPHGLLLREIPPWAMICHIVDVFDALTTKRPYKPQVKTHFEALSTMCKEMSEKFDPSLLVEFIVFLGPMRTDLLAKPQRITTDLLQQVQQAHPTEATPSR